MTQNTQATPVTAVIATHVTPVTAAIATPVSTATTAAVLLSCIRILILLITSRCLVQMPCLVIKINLMPAIHSCLCQHWPCMVL